MFVKALFAVNAPIHGAITIDAEGLYLFMLDSLWKQRPGGGGTQIIVLNTCATRQTRKKVCFLG